MTKAQAILGSSIDTHVDIQIGSLPLRLFSKDVELLEFARRRYRGFTGKRNNCFSITIDREAAETNGSHDFACDFEGARITADSKATYFSGVRHEYALDSLLRMFLSWALLPQEGFLLHAATVVRNGKAFVFVGRSGAGKSTVASLSPQGSVLTDEISLLKRVKGEWRAFGTPFWGEFRAEGSNSSAPLAGIYRLVQSPDNQIELLRPIQLLKSLLPCVLFFSSEPGDHHRLLQILGAASQEISGYNLQFQKNRSFWEVLP